MYVNRMLGKQSCGEAMWVHSTIIVTAPLTARAKRNVSEAILSKVTVYQFTLYDITTDMQRKSRRWATQEAIERIGGEILDHTATVAETTALDPAIPGMTHMGFDPRRQSR